MKDCSADPPLGAAVLKSASHQLTCPFWFCFRRISKVLSKGTYENQVLSKFRIYLHWLVALFCAMYSLLIKANTKGSLGMQTSGIQLLSTEPKPTALILLMPKNLTEIYC